MFAYELAVARHDAAEILGPWTIHGALDHRVPDLLRAEFLGYRREADERINLPLGQEQDRLAGRMQDPVDIRAGIQPDILGHTSQKEVMHAALFGDGHGLPLE